MPLVSGSSVIQKGSSLGTEWQTPVISEAFRSRFSRCSSVTDSADTAIGTSCSDIAEGKFGFMIWLPICVVFQIVFHVYCHFQNIPKSVRSGRSLLGSSSPMLLIAGPFLSVSTVCPISNNFLIDFLASNLSLYCQINLSKSLISWFPFPANPQLFPLFER